MNAINGPHRSEELLLADLGFVHDGEASENKMWTEYLEDVKEFDIGLSEAWRVDADGLLTCTAIFSAVVATFITQSNSMLVVNSGDQTVYLLEQLVEMQALASQNYTSPLQPPPYPPYSPGGPVVLLNCIWLLSFLLSITAALLATSMQHWARRYIQLPQIPSMPSECARVRSSLFLGTLKYDIHHAVEIAPTLLYLSVLLFNAGLVIYFFLVLNLLAMIVLVFFALFGLAYFTLTILPCFDSTCPYSTPLSGISWHMWHVWVFAGEYSLQWILKQYHTILAPNDFIESWLDRIGNDLKRHRRCLRDGLRGKIIKDTLRGPRDTDTKVLNWLFQLPAFVRKRKIEKFMTSLPGPTIIQLFSNPPEHGKTPFREHLSTLLRSCAPGTVELDEHSRRYRLLVCLGVIHHVARASTIPNGVPLSPYLLKDVRVRFANIPLMRALWAEKDHAIRVTARSICALLARHLLRDHPLGNLELAWLQDVMGQPSNKISNRLGDLQAVDNMNIDSFVYGVLSNQTVDLPITQATSFVKTLAILMNLGTQAAINRDIFADRLVSLIRRVEEGGHPDRDYIVDKLLDIFQDVFSSAEPQP